MRIFRVSGLLVLSVWVLAGCQAPGAPYSSADLAAAEQEVSAALNEFWGAWLDVDFDEGMAFYAESPDLSLMTDGYLWESKTAAEEAFRPYFETLERQEIDFQVTKIQALAPNVVHVAQIGTYRQFGTDGSVTPDIGFATDLVWAKRDGSWKVIAYHQSEENPAPTELKSVHLFDLPPSISEADFVGSLKAFNDVIRTAGFKGNGYEFFRVGESQDPEETPVGFDYVMHGTWVDQPTYDQIHELELYQNTPQELMDVFVPVFAGQRYSRYVRIPTGGPGEG
jgi:uncharacterized protein (TIGR02246 family)